MKKISLYFFWRRFGFFSISKELFNAFYETQNQPSSSSKEFFYSKFFWNDLEKHYFAKKKNWKRKF